MKKYVIWLVGIVVLVLLFVGAFVLYQRLSGEYAPDSLSTEQSVPQTSADDSENASGTTDAPDFTVFDKDGNQVQLSSFFGKPIVLNFWASWCPPCKEEMPDFETAYQNYDDVQFLMVNMTDGTRETVESAQAHVEQQGYTFPVYFDTNLDAADTYRAYSLPMTFFIDKDGKLVAHATGMIDAETLQRGISMISSEES